MGSARSAQAVRRAAFRGVCLVASLLALFGCGRKGALIPPEALAPAPVADLKAEQQGDDFLLSWSSPEQEEGGGRLTGLAGFRLLRREVLPHDQDCENCPGAYRPVVAFDLAYPRGVRRAAGRWYYLDTTPSAGRTYQYRVVAVKKDGSESRPGTPVRLLKVAPLPSPRLRGDLSPVAVTLRWEEPPLPAGVELLGFSVYRGEGNAPFSPLPVGRLTSDARRFEDLRVEPGKRYRYHIRSVARVDGQRVESPPSNEVTGSLAPPE